MPSALVIEIARRAKGGKPVADEGEGPEEKEDAGSDVDDIKTSAAEDVAAALGIDVGKVDVPALVAALSDFHEACYMNGSKETE